MKVLSINMGADTGGVLGATARAFRNVLSIDMGDAMGGRPGLVQGFAKDAEWSVRSMVSNTNYIAYPVDVPWSKEAVEELWLEADVIHLHHGFITAERLTRGYTGKRLPRKPYVVEHHGTIFRDDPLPHILELRARGAVGICSTLDLYLIAPNDLTWVPPPVNVEKLRAMKQKPTDRILIAHAPTNRQIKSTDALIEAVERLQADGFPVDLDLIERRPWAECLERKAKADIYFDQVILGYGCNALEAWGMGIPVVAGAADETLDEMERRFGYLPFYHATEETIYDALRELVESPELRERYGRIGHDYVRRFHSEEVVVEQLKGIYRRALGMSVDQDA